MPLPEMPYPSAQLPSDSRERNSQTAIKHIPGILTVSFSRLMHLYDIKP